MKRIVFYLLVLVIAVSTGCNRASQNNAQQEAAPEQGMAPGGGFGQGRGMGQGNFDPAAMADRQIQQMTETLSLTEEQQTKLREIMIQNSEDMQKMRENMQGGDMEGMREQMQLMRDQQNEKMKSVLTDEQWQKYQSQQEEMRSRRGQGGFGGPGGGGQQPN